MDPMLLKQLLSQTRRDEEVLHPQPIKPTTQRIAVQLNDLTINVSPLTISLNNLTYGAGKQIITLQPLAVQLIPVYTCIKLNPVTVNLRPTLLNNDPPTFRLEPIPETINLPPIQFTPSPIQVGQNVMCLDPITIQPEPITLHFDAFITQLNLPAFNGSSVQPMYQVDKPNPVLNPSFESPKLINQPAYFNNSQPNNQISYPLQGPVINVPTIPTYVNDPSTAVNFLNPQRGNIQLSGPMPIPGLPQACVALALPPGCGSKSPDLNY